MNANQTILVAICVIIKEHYATHPVYLIRQRLNSNTSVSVKEYRCHTECGPMDPGLRCDSSNDQIVIGVERNQASLSSQKRNLIILDIDLTILEAARGIPDKLEAAKLPFHHIHEGRLDLELLFIGFIIGSQIDKFSMVFRKHFFDFLVNINANSEFSADLVLYTAARPEYALQVALGIEEIFRTKYRNNSHADSNSLFKMVISSTNSHTAKTIATLEYSLDLKKYENIIILDDNGRNCWCRNHMMQLKKHLNVNFILIQVPEFHVWEEAHLRFTELSVMSSRSPTFTHLVTRKQNKDNFFYHFGLFLQALHRNESLVVLFEYAVPIHDVPNFKRLRTLVWWQWFMFQFTEPVVKPVGPASILKPANTSRARIRDSKNVSFRTSGFCN